MSIMFEITTPQVMQSILRRFPRRDDFPLMMGFPRGVRRGRAFADALRAEGFLLHDAPGRVLVSAGTVDVERTWRRSSRLTQEVVPSMHRDALRRVRENIEEAEAKASRKESMRLIEEDPGMLGFVP